MILARVCLRDFKALSFFLPDRRIDNDETKTVKNDEILFLGGYMSAC